MRGDGLQPVPTERLLRNYAYVLAAAACIGLAGANVFRSRSLLVVGFAALAALACALAAEPLARVARCSRSGCC